MATAWTIGDVQICVGTQFKWEGAAPLPYDADTAYEIVSVMVAASPAGKVVERVNFKRVSASSSLSMTHSLSASGMGAIVLIAAEDAAAESEEGDESAGAAADGGGNSRIAPKARPTKDRLTSLYAKLNDQVRSGSDGNKWPCYSSRAYRFYFSLQIKEEIGCPI